MVNEANSHSEMFIVFSNRYYLDTNQFLKIKQLKGMIFTRESSFLPSNLHM